ncbi:MAG: hypothetical protein HY074_04215, partial [Deltaproteobacteria bacterium]|nr:hypothetical protein [Deltaproteobacteria bacterium]
WAQGLPCAKDGSAATIKLNLAALDPVLNNRTKADGSNPEVEGTLFHEALHFFYHDHNKGIDLCYMAEYCCFKNDEQACALMKDPKLADPNYWKTEEYLKKYTVIMFKNGRGDFAVPTAIGATLASSPADPAALKAVMEALPASELGPSGVRLLNGVILMASKRKLVGPNETSSNDGLTEGQIAAKGASAIYGQLVGVAIGPYSDDERKRLIDEKLQSMKQMVCSRPQNAEDRGTFYTTFGNDIAWIKKVWRAQGPFPASLNELTPKSICAGP